MRIGMPGLVFVLALLAARCHPARQEAKREPEPPAAIAVHALQGVSVQYVLTPDQCEGLGGALRAEFGVGPDGTIVIVNPNGLLELRMTPEGIQADRLSEKSPDSFALDGQGAVLSVSQQYFGQLEDADFTRVVPLPSAGMRLMSSTLPGVVYVISDEEPESHRVYAYFSDGTLQIEAQVPEPVVAVADNKAAVYLASAHNIFRVTSQAIDVVARLPEHVGAITSIAAAPDDKALYFTTEARTFVLSGLAAVAVLQDLGGTAHMHADTLYVWSPKRQIMVSVEGMRGFLEANRAAP